MMVEFSQPKDVMQSLTKTASCLAILLALSGCATANADVSAEEAATQAEKALEEQIGATVIVECSEPLKAKVGAKIVCSLLYLGEEYDTTLTVVEVDSSRNVQFDVDVAPTPN